MEGSTDPSTTHDDPSSVFRLLPFCTNLSPTLARVSHCQNWTTQKQFYKAQDLHFGLSSSSFLAAAYARTAMDFLLIHAASVTVSTSSTPNCFVCEAASGSCKFSHAFLVHFTALMDSHDKFQTQRLVPLIVATDLSAHVLESPAQLALLDFALFDTHDFVHESAAKRKTLDLLLAQRTWHVGTDGPAVLIGNYFFDSLPVDVFPVVREDEDRVVV
ncbi:hypothetical protein PsorP6_019053 [Peronosclerospora sorghi]|nr:hypothetical protein PsorP6_019053 [Peronosclerospora sorghi]